MKCKYCNAEIEQDAQFCRYAAGPNGMTETLLKKMSSYFKEIGYSEIQNGSFKIPSDFDGEEDIECFGMIYGKNVKFDEWEQKLKRTEKLSYGVALWKNKQYSEAYMTLCFKDKELYSSFIEEGVALIIFKDYTPETTNVPFIEGNRKYYECLSSDNLKLLLACQDDIMYCHFFYNDEGQ